MERLLADATQLTGVKYDINNLSDVYNAIHVIQGELGITGTTAQEAASTFSGSFASMKAAASNLLGNMALGQDVGPAMQALVSTTSTFLLDNFVPMVTRVMQSVPEAVSSALAAAGPSIISAMDGVMAALGVSIDGGMSGLMERVSAQLAPVGAAFEEAFGQLPSVFQTLVDAAGPVIQTLVDEFAQLDFSGIATLVSSILPALQAGFSTFMAIVGPAIDQVVQSFVGLWNAVQPLIAALAGALMPAFQVVGAFLGGFFKGVLMGLSATFELLRVAISFVTPVVQFLVSVFQLFAPVFTTVAEWMGVLMGTFAILGSAGSSLSGLLQGAWDTIKSAISIAGNVIKIVIETIKVLFSGAGSAVSVLKAVFSTAWNVMGSVIEGAGNIIKGILSALGSGFETFKTVVSMVGQEVGGVIEWVKGIFSSLWSIDISGAGRAIMEGFLGGLKAAWGAVTDFVGGIASWIAQHKGPISYDRRLLIPAGHAIMTGLHDGLVENFAGVKSTVLGMSSEIASAFGAEEMTMDSNATLHRSLNSSLTLPRQGLSMDNGSVLTELTTMRTRFESLLGQIADKDLTMYLDGDVVAQSTYDRQGRLYAREGL